MKEALPVLIAVLGYGALHSLLASRTVKTAARDRFGPAADRLYRLVFNGLAVISLMPVLAVLAAHLGPVAYVVPWPWAAVLLAAQIAAAGFLAVGFLHSDPGYFLGLRQLGNRDAGQRLVTRGAHRVVRHPLYSAALLALWCLPVQTAGTLGFAAGATLYILIGSELEERKLIGIFGEDYVRYRAKVARLIPFIF
jgi:protein-S-isoprenylcysteine O-methyltransferase Ste14